MVVNELVILSSITVLTLAGLLLSNTLYDRNIPQYITRKVGHGVGGLAYFFMLLFITHPWYAILLSGGFTILLLGARILRPSTFRGVGGSSRSHALAEIWFPLAGTLSLVVGWLWLGNPSLAIVPILFMAWGDMVTGLIRAKVYKREVKGNWGSAGMLITCLLISLLVSPFWVAAVGAVTATAAERFTPMSKGIWDDNWTIIASSLLIMIILVEIS